ncbi:hypothetical protein F5146DRAFT_549668 [Armillaria mellea]|nr:hypothetical protein F5146DRAFT_549668 [Armillaria mellea]
MTRKRQVLKSMFFKLCISSCSIVCTSIVLEHVVCIQAEVLQWDGLHTADPISLLRHVFTHRLLSMHQSSQQLGAVVIV